MRPLLALLLVLLPLAGRAQVPAAAAAAGFNTLTYGPNLIVGTDPFASPLQAGTNWQPFNFFGTSWTNYGVTTNADGSINIPTNTINGFGAQISTAAVVNNSPSPHIQGTAFGGGFYAEVTMSFAINSVTGGPAFWTNDIESMAGGSVGDLSLRHWPSQVRNYGDWIENDIAEFDSGVPANQMGFALHNFFGPGTEFSGQTFQSGDQVVSGSNLYTETVATCATGTNTPPTGTGTGIVDGTCLWNYVSAALTGNDGIGKTSTLGSGSKFTFPGGTDLTQKHKYAALWVQATASTQGSVKWYFDGVQIGNTCTWNQYNSATTPPPVDNSSPCGGSSAYSVMDGRHMALILGNAAVVSAQNPGPVTVYSVNVWQKDASQDIGPTNGSLTLSSGAALPSGYLSVSGNQIQDGSGNNVRIAATTYRGTPADTTTMPAIRAAGFNTIELPWRDAYLNGSAGSTTFDDEFSSLSLHQNWTTGDNWGIGATFDNGLGQGGPELGDFGHQWWVNPFNPSTAFASCGTNCYANGLYQIAGGALELGLLPTPAGMQIYINNQSQCATTPNPSVCADAGNGFGKLPYIGALVNNQNTNTQQFGYYELKVAVDKLAGFDFQWDLESLNLTTNSNNPPEIDFFIYTDGSGVMHTHMQIIQSYSPFSDVVLFDAVSPSFDPSVPHTYGIDWQATGITFYVDGVQQGTVAMSALPAVYASGNPMFGYLLSAANYHSGVDPATASLPVYAHVDYYRVSATKAAAGGGIANGLGCNTLTDLDACVAHAQTAGLKVILSHRGNEPPVGACTSVQQNGLWFDSGGSSGNADGCGTTGTVTYAGFKANTTSLLQRYTNNSTVIGYELHHAPLVDGTFTGANGGGGTAAFKTSGGKLIGPGTQPFLAYGIDMYCEPNPGAAGYFPSGCLSAITNFTTGAPLTTVFPKVNAVRFGFATSPTQNYCTINYPGTGCAFPFPTTDFLDPYVNTLTNLGIVVVIEDHDFPPTLTGAALTAAESAYTAYAAHYINNPLVFFETQNEPAGGDNDAMERGIYAAVRNTGNTNPILVNGGGDFSGTSASTFSGMHNIIIDTHNYGWETVNASVGGCSTYDTRQACVNGGLAWGVGLGSFVVDADNQHPPVWIFESGPCTCQNNVQPEPNMDANGLQTTATGEAAVNTTIGNNWIGGFGAWEWYGNVLFGQGNPDSFFFGPNYDQGPPFNLTPWGTQVANFIATGPGPSTSGGSGNPAISWGGGGDTDIRLACSDVGAAVNAVNPGAILFCPAPLNNGSALLSGAAKP